APELARPRALPGARREQRRRRQRRDGVVGEPGGRPREEEEQPPPPRPEEERAPRRRRGPPGGAAHRLGERERHEQHPRHGAARGGRLEERERVALRVARQLPGEEEEHVL